jgi:hypothetical protein
MVQNFTAITIPLKILSFVFVGRKKNLTYSNKGNPLANKT